MVSVEMDEFISEKDLAEILDDALRKAHNDRKKFLIDASEKLKITAGALEALMLAIDSYDGETLSQVLAFIDQSTDIRSNETVMAARNILHEIYNSTVNIEKRGGERNNENPDVAEGSIEFDFGPIEGNEARDLIKESIPLKDLENIPEGIITVASHL